MEEDTSPETKARILPILREAQAKHGYITPDVVAEAAHIGDRVVAINVTDNQSSLMRAGFLYPLCGDMRTVPACQGGRCSWTST